MTINRRSIMAILTRLEPWHHDGTDWRKVGRRAVRFVDWSKLAKRRGK